MATYKAATPPPVITSGLRHSSRPFTLPPTSSSPTIPTIPGQTNGPSRSQTPVTNTSKTYLSDSTTGLHPRRTISNHNDFTNQTLHPNPSPSPTSTHIPMTSATISPESDHPANHSPTRPIFLIDAGPAMDSHPALSEGSKERLRKLPHIAPFLQSASPIKPGVIAIPPSAMNLPSFPMPPSASATSIVQGQSLVQKSKVQSAYTQTPPWDARQATAGSVGGISVIQLQSVDSRIQTPAFGSSTTSGVKSAHGLDAEQSTDEIVALNDYLTKRNVSLMEQIDKLSSEKHVLEGKLFFLKKELEHAQAELKLAQDQLRFFEQRRKILNRAVDLKQKNLSSDSGFKKTPNLSQFSLSPSVMASPLQTSSAPPVLPTTPSNFSMYDYQLLSFNDFQQDGIKGTLEIASERFVMIRASSLSTEMCRIMQGAFDESEKQDTDYVRTFTCNYFFELGHSIGTSDSQHYLKIIKVGGNLVTNQDQQLKIAYALLGQAGWGICQTNTINGGTKPQNTYILIDSVRSFEAHNALKNEATLQNPTCTIMSGFLAGWSESCLNMKLTACELACCATGSETCRFIVAHPDYIAEHIKKLRTSNQSTQLIPQSPIIPELNTTKRTIDLLKKENAIVKAAVAKVTKERDDAIQEKTDLDALLLSTLPIDVAHSLKSGKLPLPKEHTQVTILYCNIVGFTFLAKSVSPSRLAHILSSINGMFDDLIEHHSVYKADTLGDILMVMAGAPASQQDHASCIANLALDMIDGIKSLSHRLGEDLGVRIGIHTGPVVTAVLGAKVPRFHVFGETVNIAAHLERHGIPNCIHISSATHHALQAQYLFTTRGEIPAKGKIAVQTYILMGKRITVIHDD